MLFFAPKAAVFWRTPRFLEDKNKRKKILYLNLDETSIGFAPQRPSGLVVAKEARKRNFLEDAEAAVAISKQDLRGSFSLLCVIASDDWAQSQLPHLLVGNKSKLTRRFMSEIAEMPPSKLQVIRQDSAWLNLANMEQVLRLLKAALSPFMEEWQPLLLLDVAPAHLGQGFMALAATLGFCGITEVVIPHSPARTEECVCFIQA